MLHTLQEAIALTGKSRRTLYNHCDAGRVSYSLGADGRRYIETSELIRVYGALHQPKKTAQAEPAQVCTPPAHPDAPMTEATALRLAAAMERLIEIEEAKLLMLEHKPAPRIEHEPAVKPQSFADLLASFD